MSVTIQLLALALLAGAPPPSSARPVRVVVLAPVVDGELPATAQDRLVAALREGLSRSELVPVDPPLTSAVCADVGCAVSAAAESAAEYALTWRIEISRRDYDVVIELVAREASTVVARSRERCDVCGLAEASEVVATQAAALRGRLQALALEAPSLRFESTPSGALVRVDGELVGETPFDRVVAAGSHEVRAEKSGFVAESQRIEAVAGVRATVRFELDPTPKSQRYSKLRAFGWAALGIGLAAVPTGAALIAIDGDPNRSNCSGGNVDPRGNCKFIYSTLEAGAVALSIGAAMLATSVGILVATRDRRRAKVAIGPRGAAVVVRF